MSATVLSLFEFELGDPRPQDIEWLSPDEREHAARFSAKEARVLFIAGRIGLRRGLSMVMDRHPAAIEITRNAWGKPEVSGGPQFNLSHSGNYAVLVVGGAAPLGIDVEAKGRLTMPELEIVLSPEEIDATRTTPIDEQGRLRLWVRKEAVLKAWGKGLSVGPRLVSIGFGDPDFETAQVVRCADSDGQKVFSRLDLELGEGRTSALARLGSGEFRCERIGLPRDPKR
ncbi:MAG: 4'-phosphopantetheinyl transferase superfamily protein [Rhizobiaceae bacterium]|nr:4'-phosphopantetheinyl transferase superfamily protein [Rhizobiaceae bacterium]